MNKLGIIFKLFTLLLITQVGNASFSQVEFELADRYIANHSGIAISEMARTGVPASIKLAQGMLESDWGRSDLATVANNHFGIKCGGKWTGETFYKSDDDKDRHGNTIESCFRSFNSTYDSFIAHSDFLADPKNSHRYGFLFQLEATDYKKWAKGLRKAGYATDPKYPNKLIQIIEKYNLHKFDVEGGRQLASGNSNEKVLRTVVLDSGPSSTTAAAATNDSPELNSAESLRTGKVNSLKVVYGDGMASIKSIAEANRRKANQLLRFNEVFPDENYVPKKGMVVFLQRKKTMTNRKKTHHVVYEGETMAFIAHQYGIKLKSLYSKNRIPEGAEPVVGEKLNLYRQVSSSRRPKFIDQFGHDSSEGELLFLDDPDLR